MPDPTHTAQISLAQQITAVQREVALRQRVYPRWVAAGRMTPAKAAHELACMQAVLATLHRLEQPRLLLGHEVPHGCCGATARAEAVALAKSEEHAGHLQQLLAGLYDLLDDSRASHGVPAFDAARAYLAAHGLRRIP